ncbi:hypothetical protein L6164_017709 [Bauhinia variegata]|uniref:Uncharacterized protein n=1 Tax=Bauhinia variegata TaxID=167791 RepID=A0ACB9N8L9_BAUVA|nr:hypothetical protein L6164_017709 [Bauhinia variegata]
MSEVRDPAIKLFGRDIPVEPIQNNDSQCEISPVPEAMNKYEEFRRTEVNTTYVDVSSKQKDHPEEGKGIGRSYKNSTLKVEAGVNHRRKDDKTTKRDMDHQEKILKKPDKVLPCPRCNSLETKFCYFNNYNVNQPRHFCKNCQRYWTAGGTIRNVPVGAGKRKNKHSALQCCEVAVAPDAVSVNHADSNPASHMQFSSSGFPAAPGLVGGMENTTTSRKDASLCESLDTVLNLNGQKKIDDGEDPSSSSSRVAVSGEKDCSENGAEQVDLPRDYNGFSHLHPLPYYPVPSWGCQWSPCWNPMVFRPSSSITPNPVYMGSAAMMTVPRFSAPTIDIPVAPSSFLGCLPSWVTEKEEFSSGIPSPSSPATSSGGSDNRSPTLGKHSRDANTQTEDTTKQYLWVPKTLRINDPKEAAKSSIWSTLETKSEQNKPIMKGGVFKSFEPKSDSSSQNSPVLRANPAALSRSDSFQERM